MFVAAVVAALFSFSVSAQVKRPPQRGDVSYSDMEPYLKAYLDSQLSKAQTMLDALDAEKNIRLGTRKYELDGQEVYYEPYSVSAHIMAKKKDGSEPQSLYYEGEERRTGKEYTVKEGVGDQPFVIKTEKTPEGRYWSVEASWSKQTSDISKDGTTQEFQEIVFGDISAWYTPLKVHVKNMQVLAPVYVGGSGAVELLLTDIQDRYVLDQYTLQAESENPEIFTVSSPTVTTGANGKANVKITGVKEGKGKLTVKIHLSDPDTGSYVDAESTIEVEVQPAEEWQYTLQVHDAFIEPADDYTLTGTFKVVKSYDEADSLVHSKMVDFSQAVKSNAGSYPAEGGFRDEVHPELGFGIGFNKEQVIEDAALAKKQQKEREKKLRKDAMRFVKNMLFGTSETYDVAVSLNPVSLVMATFSEGTRSFELSADTILELAGVDMNNPESVQRSEGMSDAEMQERINKNMQDKLNSDHCFVLPELKKIAFMELGNLLLIGHKTVILADQGASEETVAKEFMCLRGTLTLTKLK